MQRIPVVFIAVAALGCGPQVLVPDDGDITTGPAGTGADADAGALDDGNATPPAGEHGDEGDPVGDSGDDGVVDTGVPDGVCGDGVVDPGEACDDGNALPGDGCEPDCTVPPGQLLWSLTADGGGGDDAARAVAVSAGGEILVVGSMQSDAGDDVWLRVLTADGATTTETLADFGGDEFGTTVAIAPNGRPFVGGVQASVNRAVLLAYEQDALVPVVDGDFEITPFSALASPTADGFAFVTHAGGFNDLAATLRRYDVDGVLVGDGAIPPGVIIGAAIPSGAGGTILGGGAFGGMGTPSTVWLGGYGSDGSAQWESSVEAEEGFRLRVRGVAMDADGRIVGVGTRETGGPNGESEGWVWWWSSEGQPDGDGPLDIGGASARPAAVVVGSHGLIVAGTLTAFDDGFIAGLDADGTPQWGQEVSGDLGLEDRVAALALVPGGVVAVGDVVQMGTGQDAWIGLFTE